MRGQKRFLSLILAFVMAISLLPATAFAEGEGGNDASDSLDLDGKTFAIVNGATKVAMLASSVDENDANKNRAGQQVNLLQAEDGSYYIAYWNEKEKKSIEEMITQWTFEKVEDSNESSEVTNGDQYYISTGEDTNKQYLKIGTSNTAVTLSNDENNASKISVTKDNESGLYKLADSTGVAINLFESKAEKGFGSYKVTNGAQDPNEWQALCTLEKVGTVKGISPIGTTIDLFDYWVNSANEDGGNYDKLPLSTSPNADSGINKEHSLKFTTSGGGTGHINVWTGTNGGPRSEIVQNTLLETGYPVLTPEKDTGVNSGKTGENESLAYLFDDSSIDGKTAYSDVKNLLQIDENGYFAYDSQKNFASLNTETKEFTLYDTWGVTGAGSAKGNGQFFPFDSAEKIDSTTDSNSSTLNHFFGMHMSTQFVQKNGGKTKDDKPIKFEFTGDDDVWIFIDGVLVGDLGGIHDAASISIDFSTGNLSVNGGQAVSIYSKYQAANQIELTKWTTNNGTFADDTYHTLDFFYLERGGGESNLQLKFNMEELQPTYLVKADQDGRALEGVDFNLYVGDSQSEDNEKNLIATGTTDKNGEIEFVYASNMGFSRAGHLLSLQDVYAQNETKIDQEKQTLSLTLVEANQKGRDAEALTGYRTLDKIPLRIQRMGTDKNPMYVLLSDSKWTTGAYAVPSLAVTSNRSISSVSGSGSTSSSIATLGEGDGFMFAVVLKWVGSGKPEDSTIVQQANWAPVHGDAVNGWTVEDDDFKEIDTPQGYVSKLCELAKAKENFYYPFEPSSEGGWRTTIEELPGDITKYYYMLGNDKKDTQYTIAYYYTSAATIDTATGDNTWRVDGSSFERDFSAKLYVPNIRNYLVAQHLDEQGTAVNGAVFTLYKSDYASKVEFNTTSGALTITPAENTTNMAFNADTTVDRVKGQVPNYGSYTTKGDSTNPSRFTLKGAAYFSGMPNGTYYLVETKAPEGYLKNDEIIMVIVDDDGVHAYAGNQGVKDGVSTVVGVGSLVASMAQFGSSGEVDQTLTKIWATKQSNTSIITGNGSYTLGSWSPTNDKVSLIYDIGNEKVPLQYTYEPADGSITPSTYGFVSASGWTWAKVTQRDANRDKGNANTNITDLKDTDLTKLFSGSTTVRVASQGKGDLTVKNIVQVPEGKDKDPFDYTLNFTYTNKIDANVDLNTDPLVGTFSYVISKENSDNTSGSTDQEKGTLTISKSNGGKYSISQITVSDSENGNTTSKYFNQTKETTFTLADGESLTIQGLPTGTSYTVTEKKNDAYSTTVAATSTQNSTLKVTQPYTAQGTIAKHEDKHTVTYTNTRSPFTIGKAVDKPRTTVGNTLTYTITVKNISTEPLTNITVTDTLTSSAQGKVTFINLPTGVTVENGIVKINSLEANKTVTITAIYTTTAGDVGTVTNEATGKVNNIEVTTPPVTTTVTDPPTPVNPVNPTDPAKPVTPPDSLNTEDHFAYIIGYPEDYYTGLPTDDQTKKPVKPEGNITRAEVATIFFRLLTDEVRNTYWSQTCDYSDVTIDKWYNNAICTLSNFGILKGYEDGTFRPDGNITRAEFATIAVRFFEVEYNGKDLFPDINGHWAQDYINQAGFVGLVEGYPDGTFGPEKLITRAEAVTIVNRTIDRHPHKDHLLEDMLVWPDNMDTTKWYYADMQEATNSHEYTMHTKTEETESQTKYEIWQKLLPVRDWEAFEKAWADANAAPNPGEVVQ